MADLEQQQLLAAEPEECSRSSVIFLVDCTFAALFSIAIFVMILLASIGDPEDKDLKILALTLLLILVLGLAAAILSLLGGMLLQRDDGNPEGERFVDKLLLLW